jgi:hypothetical protein
MNAVPLQDKHKKNRCKGKVDLVSHAARCVTVQGYDCGSKHSVSTRRALWLPKGRVAQLKERRAPAGLVYEQRQWWHQSLLHFAAVHAASQEHVT